jgi:ADP-dependent NAD(P)H-hydrate dehydratase
MSGAMRGAMSGAMKSPIPVTRDLLRSLPLPEPGEGAKEERGAILVVAGSREVPGAALLAATAALRAGAGKLAVATVASVAVPFGLAMPEALTVALPETEAGALRGEGAATLLERFSACDATLIGPGMTADAEAQALAAAFLEGHEEAGIVLDAGALKGLEESAARVRARRGATVITPHAGEMAHLLGRERAAVEADPLGAAREAVARLGVVAVMKGACTYVVTPAGDAWVHDGGHVGLATSGSGDVLAGIITGLIARGADACHAALWGVHVHGEAGRRLARTVGPLGFLARELPGEVPRILAELGAGATAA